MERFTVHMEKIRDANGNYTADGLKYPGMKADIELCHKYLSELCEIVWAGGNRNPKMTMWSIPPRPDNFDMQLSAAFDELSAYRAAASLGQVQQWAEAEKDGRLVVLPCKVGDPVFWFWHDGTGEPDGPIEEETVLWFYVGDEVEIVTKQYDGNIGPVGVGHVRSVFLTREEAEAALQNGGDGDV